MLHMDDYAADQEDVDVQDDYLHRWNDWNDDGWNDGDVYLHYDPQEDVGDPGPSKLPTRMQDSQQRIARRFDTILEGLPVPGPSGSKDGPPPPPALEPPKKKTRRKKAVASEGSDAEAVPGKDISQDDLNAKLKDAILKDETLYLRVLRYEVGRHRHLTQSIYLILS